MWTSFRCWKSYNSPFQEVRSINRCGYVAVVLSSSTIAQALSGRKCPLHEIAGCLLLRGLECIEVHGDMIRTFKTVHYIASVRSWEVSVKRGSTVLLNKSKGTKCVATIKRLRIIYIRGYSSKQTYFEGRSRSRSIQNAVIAIMSIRIARSSLVGQTPGKCHQSSKNDITCIRRCRCALYGMNMLHVTAKPQVVYRAVYMDWKLLNDCEKLSFSETRTSYQNLPVTNQEKGVKNTLVGPSCRNVGSKTVTVIAWAVVSAIRPYEYK